MIRHALLLIVLWLPVMAIAQTATRERVNPDGPYRSQVRILEQPVSTPTFEQQLRDADGYGRALLLRQLALQDLAGGDMAAAIARLEQALALQELSPFSTAQMQANLGQLYAASERYPDAIAQLQQAVSAGIDTPVIRMTLAASAVQLERYEDAMEQLLPVFATPGDKPDAWLELAVYVAWQSGQHPRAISWQRALLDRSPADDRRWHQLAALYSEGGQSLQAAATLAAGWQRGVITDQTSLLQLVRLLQDASVPDIAAQWLAAQLDGTSDPRLWLWLAGLQLAARDDAAALETLHSWAQIVDTPEAWLQTGELAVRLDDARSMAALRRAAVSKAAGPTRSRALVLLGQQLVLAGQYGQARAVLRQALEYGGNSYRVAHEWLDRIPVKQASEQLAVSSGESVLQPEAPPPRVDTRRVTATRVYSAAMSTTPTQLTDDATRLVRDLVRTTRREKLDWTGPLQIVVVGDISGAANPISLSVAAPIRRVAPSRGRFSSGELAAFSCTWTRYEGPWSGLRDAWQKLYDETVAAGHTPSGEARQVIFHRAPAEQRSIVELQIGIL